MPIFSKKYNIKINNTDNIIERLSNIDSSFKCDKEHKSEIYFVDKSVDVSNIDKFSELNNYVLITNDNKIKQVILFIDNKKYITNLDDLVTTSQILFIFNYKILLSLSYDIYKFRVENIYFYIICLSNGKQYLTFDECIIDKEAIYIIDLLQYKFEILLDNNLYYDIIEEKFNDLKNKRGDI